MNRVDVIKKNKMNFFVFIVVIIIIFYLAYYYSLKNEPISMHISVAIVLIIVMTYSIWTYGKKFDKLIQFILDKSFENKKADKVFGKNLEAIGTYIFNYEFGEYVNIKDYDEFMIDWLPHNTGYFLICMKRGNSKNGIVSINKLKKHQRNELLEYVNQNK